MSRQVDLRPDDPPVALVSGGSRGLGRAISSRLAAAGALVVVNFAHSVAPAEDTVADIVDAGGTAVAARGDVTTEEGAAQVVAQAQDAFGPISVLVNNATGPQPERSVADSDWATYLDQLRFTVGAPLHLGHAVLDGMRERSWGRIVNVGSDVVARPATGLSGYATAKAAMIGMTRAWAHELGPDGITVNLVAPGFVPVERHGDVPADERSAYLREVPVPRVGEPRDVGEVVAFLASDAAAYVTGQVIAVNGGRTTGI